ncbi:MAG: HEAT repeat domain-containing protein [Planctomycetota bacterium]
MVRRPALLLAPSLVLAGLVPAQRGVVRHAELLPPDAVVAASWADREGVEGVAKALGLGRLVADPDAAWPRLRRAFVAGLVGADAPELGVAERLGSLGFGLAVRPGAADGAASFVAVADVDPATAAALARGLARRASQSERVRTARVGAVEGYVTDSSLGPVAVAVLEDVLVVARTADDLAAVVQRRQNGTAGLDRVLAARRPGVTAEPAGGAVYFDARRLRGEQATDLGLDAVTDLVWTVRAADGQIVEAFDAQSAQGKGAKPGVLGALVPSGILHGEGLGSLLPDDVSMFAATRFAVADPKDERITRAALGDAAAPLAEAGVLDGVLPHGPDRMVTRRGRPADASAADEVLAVFDLEDAAVLTADLEAQPGLRAATIGAFRTFARDGGSPQLAVGEGWLVVGARDGKRLLRFVQEHGLGATDNVLLDPLKQGRAEFSALGIVDLGARAKEFAAAFGIADRPGFGRALARFVAALPVGTVKTRFQVTPRTGGFGWSWTSKNGSAGPWFVDEAVRVGEGFLAQHVAAEAVAQAAERVRDRKLRVVEALAEIRDAGLSYFAEHGETTDLAGLLGSGVLAAGVVDGFVDANTARVEEHRVTVVRAEQDAFFAVIAWPNDRQVGEVFACTSNEGPLRNDLLASVSGLERPELQDLFVGGQPGRSWTPGWRAVGVAEAQATAVAATEDAPIDPHVLASIEQFEKLGASAVPDLITRLDQEDPRVTARIAEALIRIGDARAAPALARLVRTAEDPALRRTGLRGLRSLRASDQAATAVAALDDADIEVRTLAATFVGEVGFRPARERLVAVVDRSSGLDAAAALVALAEIGDPGQLLAAAAACRPEEAQTEQALAWMFQQLSPKLDAGREATVLMAVLEHEVPLLRRYAIQRLGELGDPRAVAALERRLAREDAPYVPLLELALAACRGEGAAPATGSATGPVGALWASAEEMWADREQRTLALSALAGGLVLILGLLVALRRGRHRREAETWAELTRPSAAGEAAPMPKSDRARSQASPTGDVDAVRWPGTSGKRAGTRPKATRR